MKQNDENREMQVDFQGPTIVNVLIVLVMLVVMVWLLMISYNNVIPNITKQGSLKLGRITWPQALSLMVLSGMLCCARM